MSDANSNGRVVILTGAGASVKLGIPAMTGMMRMYLEQAELGAPATRALELLKAIRAPKDVEDTLLAIERAINFTQTVNYKLTKDLLAQSGVGSSAAFARQFGRLRRDMQALRSHLLGWIATTCFQFNRDEAERIWAGLCKTLANKAYPVFTTNYDFALEEIAEVQGVPVIDNFKLRRNRWFWDESLSSFSRAGLRVVKLHGSVNWYMAEAMKTIEKLNVDARRNTEGIPLERVVIFPTRFKDIYETHYFALYNMFLETLRAADVLIVIGHSLRDEYIRAAIRESFRYPNFHLVVVSPRFPSWSDIPRPSAKGNSQTTHVPFKFEDFSLALDCILKDAAPSAVPKECAEIANFRKRRRKSKISFDKPPRSIERGKSFESAVRIEALALRRAEVVATILYSLEATKARSISLPVVEKQSRKPLVIRGLRRLATKVVVQVPTELPTGRQKMTLALVGDDGNIIAQKEYAPHVR